MPTQPSSNHDNNEPKPPRRPNLSPGAWRVLRLCLSLIPKLAEVLADLAAQAREGAD